MRLPFRTVLAGLIFQGVVPIVAVSDAAGTVFDKQQSVLHFGFKPIFPITGSDSTLKQRITVQGQRHADSTITPNAGGNIVPICSIPIGLHSPLVLILLLGISAVGVLWLYRLNQRMKRAMDDRQLAEIALRKNELLYRTMLESQPGYVCVYNRNCELRFANEAYADWIGLPMDQIMGACFLDYLPPGDCSMVRNHIESITQGCSTKNLEYAIQDKVGRTRWIIWTTSALTYDQEGMPVEFLSVGVEITQRKEMEEALRRSEEKYRLLADHSEDIVFTVTLDGNIGYVSPSVVRITGFALEEIMDQLNPNVSTMGKQVITDFLEHAKQHAIQVTDEVHTRQFEIEVFRKGKNSIWMNMQLTPIYQNGVLHGILGAARDITYQQHLDLLVTQQNELLATIINDVPAHIAWFDHEGRCVGANDSMVNFLRQASTDSILGKALTQLPFPQRVSDVLGSRRLNEMDEGQPFHIVEETVAQIGGEELTLEMIIRPLGLINGQGKLVILFDITKQRQEQKILKEALARAESATHAKSIFLANISHEIRTPMTSLCGLSRLLMRSPLDEKQQKYVKVMEASASHLLMLINDILDLSKLEVGKIHLQPQPCLLTDICQESVAFFNTEAAAKGVLLTANFLGDTSTVMVDRLRLKQALTNLISNAVKFTESGVITLGCRQAMSVTDHCLVKFWVQDTGQGISLEQQTQIFDPFYQVGSNTGNRHGGAGLGLSICRTIIESMGGKIQLHSELGKGSRFYFDLYLPIAKTITAPSTEEAVPEMEAMAPTTLKIKETRVLLVEDDEFSRFTISEMLAFAGAKVTVAENAIQAIEYARTGYYELYLFDLMLPDTDGFALARVLREFLPTQLSAKFVLITASTDETIQQRCAEHGFDSIFIKPPTLDQLVGLLNTTVNPSSLLEHSAKAFIEGQILSILPESDFTHIQLLNNILWRTGSEVSLLKELGTIFLKDYPTHLANLTQTTAREDWIEVGKFTHRLRSTSRTLGAHRLLNACEAYEASVKREQHSENLARVREVIVCLDRVALFLGKLVELLA